MSALLDRLARDLAADGLILRGALAFGAGEEDIRSGDGRRAGGVVLVGQRGGEVWPHFQQWLSGLPETPANPLDTWSRTVIGRAAAQFDGWAVSPNDRPYLPFQTWAMRAEGLRASPLGLLMHPRYGVWHAYRGAMLFPGGALLDEVRELIQPPEEMSHICDACDGKPCRNACPAAAHSGAGFDYPVCLAHVRSDAGRACRETGCLDRNACPAATEWRYPADMQRFFMAAFAGVGRQS